MGHAVNRIVPLPTQVIADDDGVVHPNAPSFDMPSLVGDERAVLLGLNAPPAQPEVEFATHRPLADLIADYCGRRERTNEIVRSAPSLEVPCRGGHRPLPDLNLRWVLLHLLEETSHHAGHADATRELLDGRRSTD